MDGGVVSIVIVTTAGVAHIVKKVIVMAMGSGVIGISHIVFVTPAGAVRHAIWMRKRHVTIMGDGMARAVFVTLVGLAHIAKKVIVMVMDCGVVHLVDVTPVGLAHIVKTVIVMVMDRGVAHIVLVTPAGAVRNAIRMR